MATTLPKLELTLTTDDGLYKAHACAFDKAMLPPDLPEPPQPVQAWTMDWGLPFNGMGISFFCLTGNRYYNCEVHCERGTVVVDEEQGFDELNEDIDVDPAIKMWLMDAAERIVRHIFNPLIAPTKEGECTAPR